jgi:hypothetical protein
MLPSYHDITSRIPEPPTWYDASGTPRYGDFSPGDLGVYDHLALLVRIACQSCQKEFLVAGYTSHNWYAVAVGDTLHYSNTLENIAPGFHYGDPPRHGCVGDTMNCEEIEVVEAWERSGTYQVDVAGSDWVRRADIEALHIDDRDDANRASRRGWDTAQTRANVTVRMSLVQALATSQWWENADLTPEVREVLVPIFSEVEAVVDENTRRELHRARQQEM